MANLLQVQAIARYHRHLQRCGFTAAELNGIERENALRIVGKGRP